MSPDRPDFGSDETDPDHPENPRETESLGATEARDPASAAGWSVPQRIGPYSIKRAIATGGMGTVYEAVQEKPRRTVALKLMRAGIASRSALRRFEYESQLLARLRHPGIAQVYEAGTHRDGLLEVPYFAMEYIVGAKPVTEYVIDAKLGTRERMKLFAQVCDAVHHGHQKGIIHRDLKPSNILVDSSGRVKIIDFGVARSTDSDMAVTTLQTDVGQLIGTVQYMSPEQCAADPHDIDTRSDVYALGVVFYEMLSEQLPYDVKGSLIHEATRVIREQAPTRLSSYNRTLRGDVETIALKALEKDRDRRYQSASDFRQDIQRYLNSEPITARRASIFYMLSVFARRHRAAFVATAAVMVTLLAATVVSTTLYVRAQRAEARAVASAETSRQEARRAEKIQEFVVNMLQAAHPSRAKGAEVTVAAVLEQAIATIETELADDPNVEIGVREAIAGALNGLGRFGDEAEQWDAIAELCERLDGPDSARGLRAEQAGALATYQDGRASDGLERMRAVAPRIERVYGRESAMYVFNQGEIGNAMRALGQAEQAEPVLQAALQIARGIPTLEAETATVMLNLGWVYLALQRYSEAEPLFLEGVAMRERLGGREDPWTIRPKQELAGLYLRMNRYADAERWSGEALETARKILPAGHDDLHNSFARHVAALEGLGRLSEAEAEALQLRDTFVASVGVASLETAGSLLRLARLAAKQGAFDRQREYAREAAAAYRECAANPDTDAPTLNDIAMQLLTLQPEDLRDPATARACAERAVEKEEHPYYLDTLALALHDAGDLDRALAVQRRAVERAAVDNLAQSITLMHRFGDFAKESAKADEIEPLLRSIWRQRRDTFGELDNRTIEVLTTLAINLSKVERYDMAVEVNREIVEAVRRKHEGEHPEVALALGNLGATLVYAGRAAEADAYLRESTEMYERVSGPTSFTVGNFRAWLGRALGMSDRFEEGATELSAAYQVLAQASDGEERARRAAGWLGDLYERWEAAAPGNGHGAKAVEWRRLASAVGSQG